MASDRETSNACDANRRLLPTSDLNWLLHRAAQRFGDVLDAAASEHGVSIREQLVLASLIQEPARAQLSLGVALGLDKTTLTTTLDRLESNGLVVRRPHPTDRRVRVPEVTARGRDVQRQVAEAVAKVEHELLQVLGEDEQQSLRTALHQLVHTEIEGRSAHGGSCI
ncbi:MAG TPA: MarR family transcriptional regulator [Pseudonocardiaceae bacterium]|nr:MarR family transcriptional regulator [Pseudonocardiaceae bacterium]